MVMTLVSIGIIYLNWYHLNCGAPQGSVLGPLIFLLYITDLNQAIKLCKVYHFVDDTK